MSPDSTIAQYTIVSKIGEGGMGEVYLARDTRLDRQVAIKILPAKLANDQDRLLRFEQEARATSALNHPNILTVYDIGTHDGAPYLVAELLEEVELAQRDGVAEVDVEPRRVDAVLDAERLAGRERPLQLPFQLRPGDDLFAPATDRFELLARPALRAIFNAMVTAA